MRLSLEALLALALPTIALAPSGCGPTGGAAPQAKAPEFSPADQTKCGLKKSQARPLIVEWPSSDRLALEARAKKGLVAVRYSGCEMEVLDRCKLPGSYGFQGGTRKEDRVVIRSADELYANLPVGAARLEGQLARAGQLTVSMTLVGRWEADRDSVRRDELSGECAEATHFISAVTTGAFDFYAEGSAEARAGVEAAGVGAGARARSERESLTRDGDAAACEKASPEAKAPPPQCGAAIRVEVVPLGSAKQAAPSCPEGTSWDGAQCVGKRVVTQVDCPSGSRWDGARCVGEAPAAPAPNAAPAPSAAPLPPAAQPAAQPPQPPATRAANSAECRSYKGDFMAAFKASAYACVREMLLPLAQKGTLAASQARYLKAACASLGDVACQQTAVRFVDGQ